MELFRIILLIVSAFFVAAIPWGVVLGRTFKGIDIREGGSGATGTTNSLRMLGWRIAAAVFVLDFVKGLIPVVLARVFGFPDWSIALVAIAATAGHCWSPYIRMKGGKGVATGGGAAVGMFPWLFLIIIPVIVIVWITRYVSLASLVAAVAGPVLVVVLALFDLAPGWWAAGVVGVGLIIIIQHRGNIKRLVTGTERKFGH